MTHHTPETHLPIRPLHPDDAADLYEMIHDPRVTMTLTQLPGMEYPDEEKRVKGNRAGSHRLASEFNGKVVGSDLVIYYAHKTHSGDVGLLAQR
ncbi:MAG: hypothetical protein ACE5E7_00395 [Anaerolineae bacterium]